MFKNLGPFLKWGLKPRLFYICCWAGPGELQTLEEYNAHEKNGTWVLASLPPGKKTVGCKWIFSVEGSLSHIKLIIKKHLPM